MSTIVKVSRHELREQFAAMQIEGKVRNGFITLRAVPEIRVRTGQFYELRLANGWQLALAHRGSYKGALLDPKFLRIDDVVLRAIQPPGEDVTLSAYH